MVLTRDRELWGAALTIERQYGDQASDYVAERIAAAVNAGDEHGLETIRAISVRLDQLRKPSSVHPT